LVNVAKVHTGNGSKEASASVKVTKKCVEKPKECKPGIPEGDARCKTTPTPPELPTTGAGENIATFLGLGALVTAFSYYRASRKFAVKR
jgi:LPXTG-motif cell wall-anchored protein